MSMASNADQFKQSFREEAREILVDLEAARLELNENAGDRELVEDAPAAVLHDDHHERARGLGEQDQGADVVEHADVAEQERGRPSGARSPRGARDEAVDAARAALVSDAQGAAFGRAEDVEVAHRRAVADDEEE